MTNDIEIIKIIASAFGAFITGINAWIAFLYKELKREVGFNTDKINNNRDIVNEVELRMVGEYITRRELTEQHKQIMSKLDKISDKLDNKADKKP